MKTKPMVQNEELIVTQHPDYTSEVVTLLRSNLTPKIKQERILSYHENDIAAALDLLTEEERNRLYHILDTDTLANVLEYSETPNNYINELGIRKRIDVLLQKL